MKDSLNSTWNTDATDKKVDGFSDDERRVMKERARELSDAVEARIGARVKKAASDRGS